MLDISRLDVLSPEY